ncbi:MAG TPA: hypothetical protein PLP42_00835 [Acidobacteriota bacterium]|nr:hypothetical protein [Acidobacteriota bacterium]
MNARSYLAVLASVGLVIPVAGEAVVRNVPTLLPVADQIRMQAVLMKDEVLPDKEVGFVRKPGLRQQVNTMDFTYLRETDSFGFPNRDPWPLRADLVILGDSLVMGEGTGLDRSFAGRFSEANPGVRVVNLGIAGAGPDRQAIAFRKYGARLHPKVVLSFIYLAADITNSRHFELWRRQAPETNYNRFRLSLGRNRSPWSLLRRSRFASVVSDVMQRDQASQEVVKTADGSDVFLNEVTVELVKCGLDSTSEEMRLLLGPLESLSDAVGAQKADFFVVLIPSKEEIYGRSYALVRSVRDALDRAEIDYLDLYHPIEKAANRRSPYFCRDIHLNDHGNQVVADYLDRWWRARAQEQEARSQEPEARSQKAEAGKQEVRSQKTEDRARSQKVTR